MEEAIEMAQVPFIKDGFTTTTVDGCSPMPIVSHDLHSQR